MGLRNGAFGRDSMQTDKPIDQVLV
jgi:hypothetical protein